MRDPYQMQITRLRRVLVRWMVQSLLLVVAVSQFSGGQLQAQEPGADDASPLDSSAMLEFETIMQAALDNSPAARNEESLRGMSDAFDVLGKSLIAGRPSLQMSYYDDSPLDDVGLRELETGISVNLWRPGERNDTAQLGEHYRESLEAWRDHLRLQVAGQVRQILAELASAERRLELEQLAAADARRLLDTTSEMQVAGAAAQADVLQARAQALEQQQLVLQARAGLASAEQAYRMLTSLDIKPASQFIEQPVTGQSVPGTHPTLRYLQSQVAIAAANVALTRHQSNGRPSVSVGVRRERGDRLQPYVESLAVSVNLPFGKSPATAASVSVARSTQVDTEVELLATRRRLDQLRARLERELVLLEEQLLLGQEQVSLTGQRLEMALSAFELGELDLTRVIIAQQQARQAQRDYLALQLQQQRLGSEYNQTIGVLP